MKIKCSQCGCTDLEKVDFPYEAILREVGIGIVGESFIYDLDEHIYTDSYICTQCGHFEFFNSQIAEDVLKKRAKIEKIQKEINDLDKQISNKNNEIKKFEQQINLITEQLKSIDITIRQSIELKSKQQELTQNLKLLEQEVITLCKKRDSLKNEIET